ncbi:S8 family serine peptidase [Streptomyces sp. CBMA152]|uniref:S8 family serine peptidase n=1 Tax=Streptomyces sp. CBMA152 TaxID=1896312 RepID=UPI001660F0BD|nr:S8 family serine peptidase [Streptomyces sp. CBMA152]MBD0746133.1 serine protease [Streptomyces sp. CBMA152]
MGSEETMVESAGAQDPGPEGAGFAYHPMERELIAIGRAGAVGAPGTAGAAASPDSSPLDMFLLDQQLTLEPLFGSEARVREALAQLPGHGQEVPDLTLFHRVRGGEDRMDELASRLGGLPGIETAYVKPSALPARGNGDPTYDGATYDSDREADDGRREKEGAAAPDFSGRQGYLGPAPEGVDAAWAWLQAGGSGDGVSVVDIEGAWQLSHRDLGPKLAGMIVGTPVEDLAWRNHGTSVLGVLGGSRTGSGTLGIVPEAVLAGASPHGIGTARAITEAADRLTPGDILLIPLHRPGPRFGYAASDDQRGHIPLEWWPDDFAAVRYATARGVVVVEAAGNGADSLDDALYEARPDGFPAWWRNPFDPAGPSSGAIVVGAGAPPPGTHGRDHGPDRSRLGFSNFGTRVDAQGWGHEVTTAGGFWNRPGELRGGQEEDTWYTDAFSGTSPAAAMVAGAIAALQGMLRTAGLRPLTPVYVRDVLRATGSPQREAPGRPPSQRIGNRPDLRAAVAHLVPRQYAEGLAERFADEVLPHPRENASSLRLYVNGAWRTLTCPEPHVRQAVHTAFAGAGPRVHVHVRYADDEVVGVIVTGESTQ